MKVIAKSLTNVKVEVKSGRHKFIADEPTEEISERCPVHCTLTGEVKIRTTVEA